MSGYQDKMNNIAKNITGLDNIVSKISKEYDYKNSIIESGIKDCKNCKNIIESNKQQKKK